MILLFWCAKTLLSLLLLYRFWLGRLSPFKLKPKASQSFVSPTEKIPRSQLQKQRAQDELAGSEVCVQLPLYNESGQIQELLASICKLRWPKLSVQILDDSDDLNCKGEIDSAFAQHTQLSPHIDLQLIRRTNRTGYKAGALNNGLRLNSNCDYFAIFDCDFRPPADFLEKIMPEFLEETDVAAVQAPWSFHNGTHNFLTKVQTALLGAHFHAEHRGRQCQSWVLNFNGTAGVWKKSALIALGGWSDSSVTEDLLLSYKAALRGMRIRYTEVTHCPSELPTDLESFGIQQRRWAKGHGQVLRAVGKDIATVRNWSLAKRLDALLHLNSYNISVLISVLILLLPFWISETADWNSKSHFLDPSRLLDSALWIVTLSLFGRFYSHPQLFPHSGVALSWTQRWSCAVRLGLLAPYLSILVLDSYLKGLSKPTARDLVFERTPKSGLQNTPLASGKPKSVLSFWKVLAMSLYLAFIAYWSAIHEMWIAGILAAAQAACGLFFSAEQLPYKFTALSFQLGSGLVRKPYRSPEGSEGPDSAKPTGGNTSWKPANAITPSQ